MRWKGTWYLFELDSDHPSSGKYLKDSITYRKFFDRESSFYQLRNSVTWSPEKWKAQWKSESNSGLGDWQGPKRELYTKSFQSVKSKIQRGEWQKAVPIALDFISGTVQKIQLVNLLSRLSDVPDSLIPFGFWTSQGGVLGATPEIIYHRKNRIADSMALAGTQDKSTPCSLLEDPKNLKEHLFVVQELEKKWQAWGNVKKNPTEILELPALFHLLTKFQIELKNNVQDEDLISAFHPTSALGVFPYEKWRELESLPCQSERENYGAPLVFPLGPDETVAIVSLRQIQWSLNQIKLGAGGGVVQESQEELEWNEILAKMNSVKKLLKI